MLKSKLYACKGCGYTKQIDTNHYGECYGVMGYNECPKCTYPLLNARYHPTVWVCQDPAPQGERIPKPWRTVKLGQIAKIV